MERWNFTMGMAWGALGMIVTHGGWLTAIAMCGGSVFCVLVINPYIERWGSRKN